MTKPAHRTTVPDTIGHVRLTLPDATGRTDKTCNVCLSGRQVSGPIVEPRSLQRQRALTAARRTALFIRERLTPEAIEEMALSDHACSKVSVRRPDGSVLGEAYDVIEGLARLVVLLEAACEAVSCG